MNESIFPTQRAWLVCVKEYTPEAEIRMPQGNVELGKVYTGIGISRGGRLIIKNKPILLGYNVIGWDFALFKRVGFWEAMWIKLKK